MRISLSRGLEAVIDDDDASIVAPYKWSVTGKAPHLYAVTNLPMLGGVRGGSLLMHRLIAQPGGRMVVDHINGDTLDNRRLNLRVCEHRLNIAAGRSRTGSSPYKGVTFDKSRNRWVAQIKVNYEHRFLGRFIDESEAARAYDAAAFEAWGEFATLNFTREEAEAY